MRKILFLLLISSASHYGQWSEQTTGIPFTIFSLSAVNDNIVWASASGANILRTTNGGELWENVGANVPPPMGVEPCIFAIDANTAIFSCYAGSPTRVAYVYKTTNAGASWTLVFTQGSNAYISGIWIKNNGEGFMVGWPVGGRWSLWKTSNSGNNWDSTGLYIAETNPAVWSFENSVFYLDNQIWFGARSKGVYYSSNNGASWVLQDLTTGGYPYPSAIWFDSPTNGFSSADRNIIKTTNSGNNWTILPGSSGAEIIRGITGTGNSWWYVRFLSNQIFYTSNGGQNWAAQYTAPGNAGYNHITKGRSGSGKLWAARIDGGISVYTGELGINQTSSEIPSGFDLSQNYPNPFNPMTKLKFDIMSNVKGQMSNVKLTVFDVLGKEVKILVNQKLSPGTYEVEFDGSDLPSGVYFYRLDASTPLSSTYTETNKMVLLK
jgi:photosystem II stability/assembly factor-like uncharacterized protein